MTTRSRVVLALFGSIALIVVAAAAFTFRDRLLPVVGRLIALVRPGDSSSTGPPVEGIDGSPPSAAVAENPRGEITIDPQRQQLVGVRLAPVTRAAISPSVRTTGIVRYDETRQADVNLKLDGWIRDLYVNYTGQRVQTGDRLFSFYSPDLLATENEYLLALKTRDQMRGSQVSDAREYANRLVDAARQRLALWDLSDAEIREVEESHQASGIVTFSSPMTGYVIEKQAIQGMHVMPGQTLYKIADLSVVWIEADIYEQEMPLARVGRPATVTLDAYPGEVISGRAIYVYPFVEENSRTVKVRLQFANTRGRLKPGMFASVELRGAGRTGLTIPTDALLDSGAEQVAFVAQGEGSFTPRRVRVGQRLGQAVEILEGLKEGEQVATGAAFFLDSESQLRAGLQNYETPPGAGVAPAPAATSNVTITFRPQPDPPHTGESMFEATVKDAAGQPVTDADVSVQLFMPAMPTMNMPAMRNETKLSHAGGGVYRGVGQVMMVGRWDVTVNVSKGGQRLGSRQLAMVAK